MEVKSCTDDNAERMILRSWEHPQNGSSVLIVSGNTVDYHVVGKEKKNCTFLISDIRKVYFKFYTDLDRGFFSFKLKVDGSTVLISGVEFEKSRYGEEARKIYDYIAERNPNVPHRISDITSASASLRGRRFLSLAGILYALFGLFASGYWIHELIMAVIGQRTAAPFAGVIIWNLISFFILFTGIYGVIKSSDLNKAHMLRACALVNIFIALILGVWVDLLPTCVVVVGFVLPTLYLLAAQINCSKYTKNLRMR